MLRGHVPLRVKFFLLTPSLICLPNFCFFVSLLYKSNPSLARNIIDKSNDRIQGIVKKRGVMTLERVGEAFEALMASKNGTVIAGKVTEYQNIYFEATLSENKSLIM